jgi:hypothetical protein
MNFGIIKILDYSMTLTMEWKPSSRSDGDGGGYRIQFYFFRKEEGIKMQRIMKNDPLSTASPPALASASVLM